MITDKEIYGRWYFIDECSECHEELSSYEKMYSSGVCPYCGASNDSTIVDTDKITVRNVYKRGFIFNKLLRIERK